MPPVAIHRAPIILSEWPPKSSRLSLDRTRRPIPSAAALIDSTMASFETNSPVADGKRGKEGDTISPDSPKRRSTVAQWSTKVQYTQGPAASEQTAPRALCT